MFASITSRRLAILAISFALLVPASIVSSQKLKNKKSKETIPAGTPVLWRQPSDIATRDLYWGPGGKATQPDLSKVTLIEKEKGG